MCVATFPAGSIPGALSMPQCEVSIVNDDLIEPHETFSLSATIQNSNGQPAQFTTGGDSATAEIIDDDGMFFFDYYIMCLLPAFHFHNQVTTTLLVA